MKEFFLICVFIIFQFHPLIVSAASVTGRVQNQNLIGQQTTNDIETTTLFLNENSTDGQTESDIVATTATSNEDPTESPTEITTETSAVTSDEESTESQTKINTETSTAFSSEKPLSTESQTEIVTKQTLVPTPPQTEVSSTESVILPSTESDYSNTYEFFIGRCPAKRFGSKSLICNCTDLPGLDKGFAHCKSISGHDFQVDEFQEIYEYYNSTCPAESFTIENDQRCTCSPDGFGAYCEFYKYDSDIIPHGFLFTECPANQYFRYINYGCICSYLEQNAICTLEHDPEDLSDITFDSEELDHSFPDSLDNFFYDLDESHELDEFKWMDDLDEKVKTDESSELDEYKWMDDLDGTVKTYETGPY